MHDGERDCTMKANDSGRTLILTSIPDDGFYRRYADLFRDEQGRLWKHEGRQGTLPLRLFYCEPSGEPSGPIFSDITKVIVDGKETPFLRFDRESWTFCGKGAA